VTPPTHREPEKNEIQIMKKQAAAFQKMKDTVESVHEHIEMEYPGDAFAIWIFGTEDNVTTMVTRPESLDFARDTVSAAVASNQVIQELFVEGIDNIENTHFDGDELVFEFTPELNRRDILSKLDMELKAMFKIIEQGLNTKKMKPDSRGAVLMGDIADYVLPKFQRKFLWPLTECIAAMGAVLEMTGCETNETEEAEKSEIIFTNSIFKWRKN